MNHNHWFRSWHGAPIDIKWTAIGRRAKVPPGIVSAIAWALLDHASQAEPRGCVTDFDIETYAAFSGFEEDTIAAVIKAMIAKGVIVEDGLWKNWSKRQPKREDETAAERQRRRRTRHRPNGFDPDHELSVSRNVTHGHAMSHSVTTEKRRGEEIRKEQKKSERERETRARMREDWGAKEQSKAKGIEWGLTREEVDLAEAEHRLFMIGARDPAWAERTEGEHDAGFEKRLHALASHKKTTSNGVVALGAFRERRNGPDQQSYSINSALHEFENEFLDALTRSDPV